jgi:hypothetical protein
MRISKGDKKMKKLASIVLVIAMLFVLSISAFAAVSHQNIPVTDDMQGDKCCTNIQVEKIISPK